MRVVFTRLIVFSLMGLLVLSLLNSLEAQKIDLNFYIQSFVTSGSSLINTNQNVLRFYDYSLEANSSVIVRDNLPFAVMPIDLHLSNVSRKRKTKVNYEAIVGGAIGFAVGFALGTSMYNSDSGVPVGGLILAIPSTVIGVKMISNKRGKTKRTRSP